MPPSGNLYPNSENSAEKVEIPRATVRISLPKQRKSRKKGREPQTSLSEISTQTVEISRKGRDSQCPPAAYLYPKGRNQPKKVEIPDAACRISLPKQWKSAEKGRDSQCPRPDISTQTAKISRHLYFRTVIFYKSCVYMIKYTH